MTRSKQIRIKVPKTILVRLDSHQKSESLSNTALMAIVAKEFLEFWDAMSVEERANYKLKSAPSETGAELTPYITAELKSRLDEIAVWTTNADVYWTALLKYMRKRDLFEVYFEATPAMSKITLLRDQIDLMKVWVETGRFTALNVIYQAAIERWLERRDSFAGVYFADYEARPMVKSSDDDDWQDLFIPIPMYLHARLSVWSSHDAQTLRTIMYNAIVDFLDYQLDIDMGAEPTS